MLNKLKISHCILLSWTTLGFYRGVKDYDYEQSKKQKGSYLYSDKILYGGMYGIIIYMNPLLVFITFPKEIYRFEVCVRGLENEKKTERYNLLL